MEDDGDSVDDSETNDEGDSRASRFPDHKREQKTGVRILGSIMAGWSYSFVCALFIECWMCHLNSQGEAKFVTILIGSCHGEIGLLSGK